MIRSLKWTTRTDTCARANCPAPSGLKELWKDSDSELLKDSDSELFKDSDSDRRRGANCPAPSGLKEPPLFKDSDPDMAVESADRSEATEARSDTDSDTHTASGSKTTQ
jgi:hypothetical protein